MSDRSIPKTYDEIITSIPRTDFEIIMKANIVAQGRLNDQTTKVILAGKGKEIYLILRHKMMKKGIARDDPFFKDTLYGFLQAVQEAHPETDLKTCVMNACKQGNIHEDDQVLQELLALLDTLLATSNEILQQSSQNVPPPAFLTPYGQASGKEPPAVQEPASAAAEGLPDQALEAADAQSHEPEQQGDVLLQTAGAEIPATTSLQEQDARLAREPAVPAPDASERAKPPEQKPHKDPFLVELVEGVELLNMQINASLGKQLLLWDQVQQISRSLEEMRQQSEEMRQQSKDLFESIASLPDDYVPKKFLMQVWREYDASKHRSEQQNKRAADKIIELIDYFVNSLKYDGPFAALSMSPDGAQEQERDSIQSWKTAVLDHLYLSLLDMLQQTCGVVPIEVRIGQPYYQGGGDILAETNTPTDDPLKDQHIARVSQLGYKYTDGRPFRPAKVIFYRFMTASQGR